jgi:hypothetical protein
VIDGPRVAFSCARGRAGRRRPQVTGEATRHRVPVAPRAWTRRPQGAPATPALGARGQGSMREWLGGAVMALPIQCCGASIRPRGTADLRERPICGKEIRGRTNRRCAPATPRRREGPGMAAQHSDRKGFLGLASVLHSKRIPWRRDQPGHRSLGRCGRLRRHQRKCGKFPQALPAVRSELRPSGIVVPVWDGFSLGRRIYDG